MAGLGFKDFTVGEVLTSSDVDGYLMQQTVMRFADSGARGSALGTAAGTGVALAEGMVSYLDDIDQVQVYAGSVWRSVGGIIQAVGTAKTDTFSTNSTSYTDVTGLSVTITPTSSSNSVLVFAVVPYSDTGDGTSMITLTDGSNNDLLGPSSPGSRLPAFSSGASGGAAMESAVLVLIHSPATTSPFTYKVRGKHSTSSLSLVVNRSGTDTDNAGFPRGISTLYAFELGV